MGRAKLFDRVKRAADGLRQGLLAGRIDARAPRESHELARLVSPAGDVATLVAATTGDHYAGEAPRLSTQSEIGIAFHGGVPGWRYHAQVWLVLPGLRMLCQGEPRPDGTSLLYRTRLSTREAARAYLEPLRAESAWSADGRRLAVRLRGEPGESETRDWYVVDFAGRRWGMGSGADATALEGNLRYVFWHDVVPE